MLDETVQGAASDSALSEATIRDAALAGGSTRDAARVVAVVHDAATVPLTSSGKWAQADFVFTEVAGPGSYAASFPVLARMTVLEIALMCKAAWSVPLVFNAHDGAGHNYYTDQPISGGILASPYSGSNNDSNPANFLTLASESSELSAAGILYFAGNGNSAGPGVTYDADDVLAISAATTDDSSSPTGVLLVRVLYAWPVVPIDAVFTP